MPRKVYTQELVIDAAQRRIAMIFDRFDRVVVSISGGKDSTVLLELARREAVKRGRTVTAFFLDQEAEYAATIEHVRFQMNQPGIAPEWHQVPIRMTNATTYGEAFLNAWWPGETWMREREPDSIHEATGAPDRFYPFFDWYEGQQPERTCSLVGLRAEESLNRYRAVTKSPALDGIPWSSKGNGVVKLYPLYDWAFEDIWTFLGKENVPYNKAYDYMWAKGFGIAQMRVSNLIHEISMRALPHLQEFEHDTFEALNKRLDGIHTAALYADEASVYRAAVLPEAYASWRAYRDFLLDTMPIDRSAFDTRFADQPQDEDTYRQQCRQVLINDWENNVPVRKSSAATKEEVAAKWMELL
jgi:predicted phosphoadenosine phosphosulfate sulfurtransferase